MNVKKGDKVIVRAGKDRGKSGAVLKVDPKNATVSVEGVNLWKKRVRPRKSRQKGEVVLVARPLPASRIALYCLACKRGVRVGTRVEGGSKVRYCKKCEAAL